MSSHNRIRKEFHLFINLLKHFIIIKLYTMKNSEFRHDLKKKDDELCCINDKKRNRENHTRVAFNTILH